MKLNKILFINTLMMGTLITISSYSWFSMWIGLELNLISFIPLINDKFIYSSEASLKYFIIQAMSSMFVIFSILWSLSSSEFILNMSTPVSVILNSALLTKMGAAPFHFWFPEIMEGLSWSNAFILLTWQKIAPLILIMYNFSLNMFFSFIIITSLIVSSIKSWNQSNMKKIMTFSSINHIGWIMSMFFLNQSLWIFYFIFYSFATFCLTIIFQKLNIFNLQNLFNMLNKFKHLKLFFFLNFFSLGGIPPFLGFFPKWLSLMNLINNNYVMLAFSMVILTLPMLFIYLRMTFQALTLNFSENKLNYHFKFNILIYSSNFLNISGLLIFSILFNL